MLFVTGYIYVYVLFIAGEHFTTGCSDCVCHGGEKICSQSQCPAMSVVNQMEFTGTYFSAKIILQRNVICKLMGFRLYIIILSVLKKKLSDRDRDM